MKSQMIQIFIPYLPGFEGMYYLKWHSPLKRSNCSLLSCLVRKCSRNHASNSPEFQTLFSLVAASQGTDDVVLTVIRQIGKRVKFVDIFLYS